ncbi:hypothetical protein BZA70DRAFT_273773 [Myxozyma melibiosi]|uniref:F-box domain-containing protein n=1 Tax=Myxozyma melibiosi TaxID=54550 RepID=A0ABR1FF49_9ASCO
MQSTGPQRCYWGKMDYLDSEFGGLFISPRGSFRSAAARPVTSSVAADLPYELILSVFQHLDPDALVASSCVCRAWRSVAADDRLWKFIDISRLRPSTVLSSDPLVHALANTARAIDIKNPPYFSSADLPALFKLIKPNSRLREFSFENCAALDADAEASISEFVGSARELQSLSLSGTLIRPTTDMFSKQLSDTVTSLDLSRTGMSKYALGELSTAFPALEKLSLSCCYYLSSTRIRRLLNDLPELTDLDLSSIPVVGPRTVKAWLSRDDRPKRLDVRNCDCFTVHDIEQLRLCAPAGTEIVHSALLLEESEAGYRAYIDLIAGISNPAEMIDDSIVESLLAYPSSSDEGSLSSSPVISSSRLKDETRDRLACLLPAAFSYALNSASS